MLNTIEIENLRGIQKGKVEGLAPLSILVGSNNSGKSTVLEALYLAASHGHANGWVEMMKRRGWLGLASLGDFFYGGTKACSVKTVFGDGLPGMFTLSFTRYFNKDLMPIGDSAELTRQRTQLDTADEIGSAKHRSTLLIDEEGKRTLPLTTKGAFLEPQKLRRFLDLGTLKVEGTLEDCFDSVQKCGIDARDRAIALCRILQKGLMDLQISKSGDRYVLYILFAKGAVPIYLAGDGMKRLFHIACVLASAAGGLVLIEEPESYLHPRAMEELLKLLWASVSQGTQIVLSTHNLEFLKGVLEPGEGRDLSKAAVFLTKLEDGQFSALNIPGPRAAERLIEIGEDLRR